MEGPIVGEIYGDNYEEAKRKAKTYYAKIGRVWSLALRDYVNFNNIGFRHLIGKRGMLRTKKEQKRRFALLRHARSIIENQEAAVLHQRKDAARRTYHRGKRRSKISCVDFWSFSAKQNDATVKVVVRQFENGKKHFISIY